MSAKQYEQFLAENFIEWVSQSIESGTRYQFKSPDKDNSFRLYQAFTQIAHGSLTVENGKVDLPFIDVHGVALIPVVHGTDLGTYTENYISRLRDAVAGRSGEFQNTALLIIHNSNLDTLINSAFDTSALGAIWHPKMLAKKLAELIDELNPNADLSKCLLQDQLAMIIEDGATVFGFSPLYRSLEDGELEFEELGLFQDPFILTLTGQPSHIRNRLNENRKLRSQIEFCIEHYPGQLESVLKEFSPKFIQEHFEEKQDWRTLEFGAYLEEQKANRAQKLVLEEVNLTQGTLFERAKSQTKAGQKELNLLIDAESDSAFVELNLVFTGSDLENDQFKITHNKTLAKLAEVHINKAGGKRSRLVIKVPFSGDPSFFSVELKRDNRAEEYKFRCLVIPSNTFYIDAFRNNFRIEPLREWITLQLEEDVLQLNPENNLVCELAESGELVHLSEYSAVNFAELSNQSEEIQFVVESNGHELRFNIEGAASDETLSIPLLFDKDRFNKLFKDNYNAEFNRSKNKIVIDNNESSVIGIRLQLLQQEAELLEQRLISVTNHSQLKLSDLLVISEGLSTAYSALFDYYEHYKTLPSLVSWGSGYCNLVQKVVDEYEAALGLIPLNEVMTEAHRALLMVGYFQSEDKERLSSIHPSVLSYHLQLVKTIQQEIAETEKSTFADLPEVTRERLVASGLLPYVYHPDSGYAHIVPTKENRFWLDIIPQKQISYSYVKTLVKDKLAEFTNAYQRLFSAGERSSIILNAINQGAAEEFFLGLVEYYKANQINPLAIHINFYDEKLAYNDFDRFAETASYERLKEWLKLNRTDADLLIDLIRSRLTYSKYTTPKSDESFAYAHLAFFRNNAPVDCRPVNLTEALSGVVCNGLIAGEAAETKGDAYFTAFGLRNIDVTENQSLRLAYQLGCLWQPAKQSNTPYLETGLGLAVSTTFKDLLIRSYDSALWTTIIDPKVTLDFFANQKDVVLIHYSDQYTSAAGYDAITVTKQVDLFTRILQLEKQSTASHLLSEFNAFNGEWLLGMLTANAKERKEKNGIIGAYKFIRAVLRDSDICWVPLSVAEMIRVSGNVGLKMSDSEFSRNVHGYKKGAISDDVLFVGFKGDRVYLLPLEVKTGVRPDYAYAGKQAKELKRYLLEEVIGPKALASHLYRGLFIRQVLMQVEKFRLYDVISEDELTPLLSRREWWLKGEYEVVSVPDYVDGYVVAHVQNDSCFEPDYKLTSENILQVELPYSLLSALINAKSNHELDDLVEISKVPKEFRLQPFTELPVTPASASDTENDELKPSNEHENTTSGGLGSQSGGKEASLVVESEVDEQSLKVLFGHDVMHQKPLYWEPTNTARFMNTNTGIIGTMGTGKTQFTKSVVTQLIKNQHLNVKSAPIGMLVFDYKSDYVDDEFQTANNAKRYKLYRLPYNPLSLFGTMPMLPVHTATGFSETMAKAFGLGQKQQLKLRKLVLDAYELAGIYKNDPSTWNNPAPTIAQIWDLFLDQEKVEEDSLYAALDSLATFEIFETSPEDVKPLYDLIDGVTVIELAGYSPQIQNLVVALTLDLFYAQMQKNGKPTVTGDYRQITKMILVDEADNFMSQDFASLKKILKEGREYGVGVILSTQQMTHFKTAENNYASYILTWIVHRVSEIKNADIQLVFNQSDKNEQDALKINIGKLDKHFSLYIDGDKKVTKMRDKAFWEFFG